MNILGFFENLFHIGPSTAPTPSTFQSAVDTAGKAIDAAEAAVTTLQGLASVLPTPYQGYLAALALAVHGIDGYVDTLETQPQTAPPTVVPVAPAEPPKAA